MRILLVILAAVLFAVLGCWAVGMIPHVPATAIMVLRAIIVLVAIAWILGELMGWKFFDRKD